MLEYWTLVIVSAMDLETWPMGNSDFMRPCSSGG
mgnify:CR=1 FL=1